MKQSLTVAELAAELESQQARKADYLADSRQITMLGATELHVDGIGEFAVGDLAHGQIASHTEIPQRFYDRLRFDENLSSLLDENVNRLMRRNPARRMLRTLGPDPAQASDASYLRAFVSDRYRRRDNYELAQAILPVLAGLGEDVRFESCALTERRMYLKAVLPRVTQDVAVGDAVQAGVVISNSETGHGALSVQPMVFRLICLNGMIVPEHGMRSTHVGRQAEQREEAYQLYTDETLRKDDEAFFSKVADVVRAAVDEARFADIVKQMRDSREDRVTGDPLKAVEKLATKLDLSEGERGGVLRHLIEGGDLSRYGALNAVTRVSQDVEDYDRATQLETAGSTVLGMTSTEWEAIAA